MSHTIGVRYLALDIGGKRTGLATGDDELQIATPAGLIECPLTQPQRLIQALAQAIEAQQPTALVIGLPLNMDGSHGPAAAGIRNFAKLLEQHVKLPVYFQDERLTSAAADWHMARTGLTHKQKKQRRDSLAAAAILQDFFAASA